MYINYTNYAHNILVWCKGLGFIEHIWPITLSLNECGDECIWRSISTILGWCKARGLVGNFGPYPLSFNECCG